MKTKVTVFLDEIIIDRVWLEALKKSQRGCTSIMDLKQVKFADFKVNLALLQNKYISEQGE